MASLPRIACLVAVLCMVVLAPYCEAITCGQVQSAAIPCLTYLRSGGPVPANCCNGIRSLNNASRTPSDRQTACRCLLSIAKAIPGFNYGNANGLNGKCGVNIPYKLSPSLDCSKIK